MLDIMLQNEYKDIRNVKMLQKDSEEYRAIIDWLCSKYGNEAIRELAVAKKGSAAHTFYKNAAKKHMAPLYGWIGLAAVALVISVVIVNYLQGLEGNYDKVVGIPLMMISTFLPIGMAYKRLGRIAEEYIMHVIDSFEIEQEK